MPCCRTNNTVIQPEHNLTEEVKRHRPIQLEIDRHCRSKVNSHRGAACGRPYLLSDQCALFIWRRKYERHAGTVWNSAGACCSLTPCRVSLRLCELLKDVCVCVFSGFEEAAFLNGSFSGVSVGLNPCVFPVLLPGQV